MTGPSQAYLFTVKYILGKYVDLIDGMSRYLGEQGLQPEPFTASVFKEMGQLEDTKPGPVARSLLPLLQVSSPAPLPRPNIAVSCLQTL